MSVKEDYSTEHMLQQAEDDGIAVTSVTDRHMFIFTKRHVEGLLKTMADSGNDKCMVFVKRPVAGNGN